jgi:hypothetical protein
MVFDDIVNCATVTLEALNWITPGGCIPGGALRKMELFTDVICAIEAPISVPCWN